MVTRTGINGVRSVHFGVPDLAGAVQYYTTYWGLTPIESSGNSVYLRGTGPSFYLLGVHPHPEPRMLRIDLSISSRAHVDALQQSLKQAGVKDVGEAGPLADPGGGYGFSFRDPVEGRVFRLVAEPAEHADTADMPDRPRKVAHVVMNSPDREGAFFVDQLGFKVIDQTKRITFLNCSSDHHSLALYASTGSSLNHVAFEVPDLDSVMSASATMVEHGEEIAWGVGRHGPCNNVFSYFVGPGGFVVEYTAEVQQVDESYQFKGPDEWSFPRGRRDRWGLARPTPRLHSAETKVPYSPALFSP